MKDEQHGWGIYVGEPIVHTVDGALLHYAPIAVHFLNVWDGWLLFSIGEDHNYLYHTTDAGTDWTFVAGSLGLPNAMSITDMVFQDKQTGWLTTLNMDAPTDPTMLY